MSSIRSMALISAAVSCLMLFLPVSGLGDTAITADHTSTGQFSQIALNSIQQIQTDYRFFYGHTSHGSQILTGLYMLSDEDSNYQPPSFSEVSDDLGADGDTSWAPITRGYLDSHPDINVVLWSWCGGVSTNTPQGIDVYLSTMNQLEIDYPGVIFVYMTGHLDGSGPDGNLYAMNNLIRSYCAQNNKILFDFADIESYNPEGAYYPDGSDACEWCLTWCATHDCPSCGSCAHSHCFNCYQKGKAFWWMMAQTLGQTPECCTGTRGNVDGLGDPSVPNLSDITVLIDHLFISLRPLNCWQEGNLDESQPEGSGSVTLSDLGVLVDNLFISLAPTPPCP